MPNADMNPELIWMTDASYDDEGAEYFWRLTSPSIDEFWGNHLVDYTDDLSRIVAEYAIA